MRACIIALAALFVAGCAAYYPDEYPDNYYGYDYGAYDYGPYYGPGPGYYGGVVVAPGFGYYGHGHYDHHEAYEHGREHHENFAHGGGGFAHAPPPTYGRAGGFHGGVTHAPPPSGGGFHGAMHAPAGAFGGGGHGGGGGGGHGGGGHH